MPPAIALLLLLGACGDGPNTPSGPVTLRFSTGVYLRTGGVGARDTIGGFVVVDDRDTVRLPGDSLLNVPRGRHTFEVNLDIDYLTYRFTSDVNPGGRTAVVNVPQGGSCRISRARGQAVDESFCAGVNFVYWSGHPRVFCPVTDFMEFCTGNADRDGFGAVWPADSSSFFNEYTSHAKLLVGAVMGPEVPSAAGATMAMGLYAGGDYAPRTRLAPFPGDSSRFDQEAWTDVRHVPLFPNSAPFLADDDRPNDRFGLSVRATYYQPRGHPDVLFIRWDVTNISANPRYRLVHPNAPAGGHTLNEIYLAPVVDADIGGNTASEHLDDAATIFQVEGVVAAYDLRFNVPTFAPAFVTRPGFVGLRIIDFAQVGLPRALLLDQADSLRYATNSSEDETYRYLAGGRAGVPAGCTTPGTVLLCTTGENTDVVIGWSVGPIASLAPGETVALTAALLFAHPKAGTFTSGTPVSPQNSDFRSTSRPIYNVAENLRALAATTTGVSVVPRQQR